jgi:uncharacterized protein (DUF305 family)
MNIKNINYKQVLVVIGSLLVGFGSGATLDGYLADLANTEQAPTMQHEMDAMTSVLKGKTGDAFDKAFLEEMVIHHQGAIDMANLALQNSQRGEMKALANAIIEAQTEEIEMMRGWNDAWFNEPAMHESTTH